MRTSAIVRVSGYVGLAGLLAATAGCGKLPGLAETTLDLLEQGSPKACVAEDVRKVLRGMIRPAPGSFAFTGMADADAKRVIESFAIDFEQTTLESKDEDVSRVTCSAQAIVSNTRGVRSSGLAIRYDVRPAAESTDRFVVGGDVSGATAFLSGAALAAITAEVLTGERQGGPAPDASPTGEATGTAAGDGSIR
ncbi:hypothetical protein [Sphingomonas sanxanigenens]|uniref:Lipoprotein n=1 Tax=Sphingomonas sanxanigenens DSM 19645 = NX02 TaxID=1123269 RepID=W0A687_9SPHN|nr:hypothetical protein [Sphingomonas sanxanigenens]AHE52561.1 hypothetical protein NX02_04040 [Sphingomonas sanxanigenens DSM 19645 = NX02]